MGEYFIKTFKILIDQVKLNDFSSKIMNTIFGWRISLPLPRSYTTRASASLSCKKCVRQKKDETTFVFLWLKRLRTKSAICWSYSGSIGKISLLLLLTDTKKNFDMCTHTLEKHDVSHYKDSLTLDWFYNEIIDWQVVIC